MEDPGDLTGILSISDFISFMEAPLCCPDSKPISHLHVFSTPQENQPRKPSSNLSNSATKDKIKSSLDLFDFILFPTLIQFWAPTVVEEDDHLLFLDSSDVPFGLSVLRKGLCSFRRRSFMHKHSVEGENCGPPARVFRRRFPEFCPDVRFYSGEEFALLDHAVRCGVRGYLALPVFEPVWKHCIGVIELLTVMDGSYCLTDLIEKVSDSLKEVGLSSSDVFWPFDTKRLISNRNENGPPELQLALSKIEKGLAVLCNTHKLPFAQTWIVTIDDISTERVLSTSKNVSYMFSKKAASFQRDCIRFHLRKGQGVAWKAFLSSSSCCFCRDITQLSVYDYGLVLSARKADLTGCFAICLLSTYTGEFVYIIELCLPPNKTIYRKPWNFLNSLLATMKNEFKTFKLRSGQEIGEELPVEVNRIHKDDLPDSFVIKRTAPEIEGLKKSVNMVEPTTCEGARVHEHDAKHNKRNYICAQQITGPRRQKNVTPKRLSSGEVGDATLLEEQQRKRPKNDLDIPCVSRTTLTNLIDEPNIRSRTPSQRIKTEHNSILEKVATSTQEESFMTIKADFEGDIIKFQLSPSSGMMKLKDEVMKRLKLSAGTFKIEYLDADKTRVPLNTDEELHEYMTTMRSLGIDMMKLVIEPTVPQNEAMENEVTLIVKARHNDDLVKFDLPPLGIVGLKNEIIKRFKLEAGSFEIKYDQILLDNDAALQNCIGSMNLSRKTIMRLSIEPVRAQETTDRECLLTVKASYKDDIVKFQLSLSSGMVELKNELMKRLKLEDGSFVIKYWDKDDNEIVLDKDALLNSHMNAMKSMGMKTMKIFLA